MADKNEKVAKKPNIFARMGRAIAKFFRDYTSESKKVVWLSKKETIKNSVVVTVIVVVAAVAIALVDAGFGKLIELLGSIY